MRKLVLILTGLFFTMATFGQVTPKQKKVMAAKPGSKEKIHPLIIVDGKIFNGEIVQIDPNSIWESAVIRPPRSVEIYGNKAADGVILLKTKRQQKADSVANALINNSAIAPEKLVVIDGLPSEKKLSEIDTGTVFSMDSVSREKALQIFNGSARTGIIVIITKTAAIQKYQRQFSDRSPEFRLYLETSKGDDSKVLYVVDGIPIDDQAKTKALFYLDFNKVGSLAFKNDEPNRVGYKPMLLITLKK